MTEEQKKKHQAIVLGALLHDIGKFMQRAEVPLSALSRGLESTICPVYEGRYSHKHVLWTSEFFEIYNNHPLTRVVAGSDSIANLASYHHRADTKLHELVQLADRLSSGSDRQKCEDIVDDRENYKKARMHSILEYMAIEKNKMTTPGYRYELDPLDDNVENCFPTKLKNLNPGEGERIVDSYRRLWEDFKEDFESIDTGNVDHFIVSILSLLEKYTWCIPSSTIDRPDISLFDHSKTTAAIASALYLYQVEKGNLENSRFSVHDETKKFTLLAGDISGIQSYIFNIKNVGSGGTAKRLRARSFFLSALSDITAHKLLHAFDLTINNLIISSGGKFYLLLPNLIESGKIIENMKAEFDKWCMSNINGELAVNIASVDFSCKDLLEFNVILRNVNSKLQEKKNSPFRNYLSDESGWIVDNFAFEDVKFENEESLCKSCGKFPGTQRSKQQIVMCDHCHNDVRLGQKLTKAKAIEFFNDTLSGRFKIFNYSFSVLTEEEKESKDAYLVYQLNNWNFSNNCAALRPKYFANHIPVFDENSCRDCDKTDCEDQENVEAGNPKFFTCLAQASRGQKALGVLKADVDNLGLIFITGFSSEHERAISRVTTLSRQLDNFFTGRLDCLLRDEFKDIYTVYAGGDDLLVLGPWSKVLKLSLRLRKEFTEYCCGNPDFTLSAGMAVCKPRLPIYSAIESAEEFLKKSKDQIALGENNKKNQLSVLGDSFKWHKADNLLTEAERLAEWQNQKKVSMGFVRFLLSCGEMYKLFKNSGESRQLRFVPLLAYSIQRNINPKEQELLRWMQDLMDIKESKLNNLTFLTNYSISINRS